MWICFRTCLLFVWMPRKSDPGRFEIASMLFMRIIGVVKNHKTTFISPTRWFSVERAIISDLADITHVLRKPTVESANLSRIPRHCLLLGFALFAIANTPYHDFLIWYRAWTDSRLKRPVTVTGTSWVCVNWRIDHTTLLQNWAKHIKLSFAISLHPGKLPPLSKG